ncbi:glycosyltransferase [Asticcacaulis solisilvae]|uniref:glycosyltransferase n=1 Tax=Asticcacaulis solisilvae TaxID=1217274 RepID=UPI003FD701FD
MKKAEIILCTMGTRGDVLPFLALSAELNRRGYDTTLLANDNWEGLARQAGVRFEAIAPTDASQSGRDDKAFFVQSTLPAFRKSYDVVAGRAAQNPNLLLVYRSNMLGMESAAEKYGLAHVKVALQPSSIRSVMRPPWPMARLAQGPLSGRPGRVFIAWVYRFMEWRRGYYRLRNAFRASLGLPPHRIGRMGAQTEDLTLVLAPHWFAMPAEDWPRNSHCTGFLFHEDKVEDPAIASFIARHGAPLVFTPGTGVSDVAGFFAKAVEVCKASALPGIFLSAQPFDASHAPVPILKADFADLATLLARARLIVHHGGIGTTAQALRAGIPQIIVPDRFDQPDNAMRVARLGLGAAVLRDDKPPGLWADLIRLLTSDAGVARRLKKVASAVTGENAVEKGCDLIESVLRV